MAPSSAASAMWRACHALAQRRLAARKSASGHVAASVTPSPSRANFSCVATGAWAETGLAPSQPSETASKSAQPSASVPVTRILRTRAARRAAAAISSSISRTTCESVSTSPRWSSGTTKSGSSKRLSGSSCSMRAKRVALHLLAQRAPAAGLDQRVHEVVGLGVGRQLGEPGRCQLSSNSRGMRGVHREGRDRHLELAGERLRRARCSRSRACLPAASRSPRPRAWDR